MKKIIQCLFILQLLLIASAEAQNGSVSGQVSDATGQPVVGATVMEKGENKNGTSTNASGNFKMVLKGSSNIIVISYVGYSTQEVIVSNGKAVTITLNTQEDKGMGEVVVIGYGRQKKVTLTGSVSTISGKELRENPSASLQNTLAGRLPGFFSQQTSGRPGADGATFFIRGQSSYNTGSNQPLVIIDDIEASYDQFARIDPNEIESLSILKDASTTAIYGVKGANGVVIITTRRGRSGPPQISFRVESALMQPTKIPKF